LWELELDSNDLNTLPEGVFDDLSNLEELDLSHNALEELPAGLFHSTSNGGFRLPVIPVQNLAAKL
jgi:Leucine-rich repeat (LRR) protein